MVVLIASNTITRLDSSQLNLVYQTLQHTTEAIAALNICLNGGGSFAQADYPQVTVNFIFTSISILKLSFNWTLLISLFSISSLNSTKLTY